MSPPARGLGIPSRDLMIESSIQGSPKVADHVVGFDFNSYFGRIVI